MAIANYMQVHLRGKRLHFRNGCFYFNVIVPKEIQIVKDVYSVDFNNGVIVFNVVADKEKFMTVDIKSACDLFGVPIKAVLNCATEICVVRNVVSFMQLKLVEYRGTKLIRCILQHNPGSVIYVLADKPEEVYMTNINDMDVVKDILEMIQAHIPQVINESTR